jgi:hypothetical protein
VEQDPRVANVGWVGGLTFDTRRRRVLVLGYNGPGGGLYAYDPAGGGWSVVGYIPRSRPQSLTYAPEEDALYASSVPYEGGRATISRLDPATGALLREVHTSESIPTARAPGAPPHQLVAAGRQLALLTAPLPDLDDPDMPLRMRCYVVDPVTGRVTYRGPVEPHAADAKAVTAEDVDTLWQALSDADDAGVDLILWRLAAGGDRVVAMLRAKFVWPPADARPGINPRVRELVARLADREFRVRERASAELAAMGQSIELDLKAALDANPPPETRTRLQVLLRQVREAAAVHSLPASDDPDVRREQRAIRALGRIGTAAAVDVLKALADGPADAPQTRQAVAALRQLGRD